MNGICCGKCVIPDIDLDSFPSPKDSADNGPSNDLETGAVLNLESRKLPISEKETDGKGKAVPKVRRTYRGE